MIVGRSSNFELLRIISILFVIILHYNTTTRNGAFAFIDGASFVSKLFLYGVSSFALCAVNVFMCVSGYFLSQKNTIYFRKIAYLFLIIFSYRFLAYGINSLYYHQFSVNGVLNCFIPQSYFLNLYCVVFLISPFLNLVTKNLNEKEHDLFIKMLVALFAVIPTITDIILPTISPFNIPSVSTVSLYGNGRGFTLINFVMCYYIGGYIAKKRFANFRMPMAVYILSSLVICAMMFVNRSVAWSYCNLFVVLQAGALLAAFKCIHFQSNFINIIAKSCWGVFCIHGLFMDIYSKNLPYNLDVSMVILFLHLCGFVIFVFISSVIWDKVCSFLLKPVDLLFDKIEFLNKKICINANMRN